MADASVREVLLRFLGDGRSAVKSLEGIAAASGETTEAIKGDSEEQAASLDTVTESSNRLRDSFMGLAGLLGIGAVGFGLKDLVEGGEHLQSAQSQLQAAIKATGDIAVGAAANLEKYATSLSTKGGYATTENLAALTQFVTETHSATKAQQMLALATNIGRATGDGLADAQGKVAKAYDGQARGLQALLGPLASSTAGTVKLTTAHQQQVDTLENEYQFMGKLGQEGLRQAELNDHITAQQAELATLTNKRATAQQILAAATTAFAGRTAIFNKTTAGQLSNLKNAFDNLTEELGKALLPAFDKIIGAAAEVAKWMEKNKTVVGDVVIALAALSVIYGTVKAATLAYNAVLAISAAVSDGAAAATQMYDVALINYIVAADGANLATKAWIATQTVFDAVMDANPVGLVVLAIVALIAIVVEMIDHWKQVESVVVSVWHGIEAAADAAADFIAARFRDVEGAVVGVWHFIEKIGTDIFNALTFPFRKAFDFIKGGVSDVEKAVGDIGHFISHPFGLARGGVVPKYLASGGPSGTDTVPAWLTPGEGVLSTQGMAALGGENALGAINAGQGGVGGNVTVNPSAQVVNFKIADRVFAEAMIQYVLNRAARGPSSLVGGSLVTGGPGLPVSKIAGQLTTGAL